MKRAHQQIQRKLARPVDGRRPWIQLIDAARRLSGHAAGLVYQPAARDSGAALDGFEDLRHLRRQCRPGDFPVAGASAGLMADAFLKVVDAFAGRETPSGRREDWGPALSVLADKVMDLLHEQRLAEQERDPRSRAWRD